VERNLTDAQARALAQTGGVIGVHFSGGLIDRAWQEARARSGYYDAAREGARALRARCPNPYEFLAESFSPWEWPPAYGTQPTIDAPLPTLSQLCDHIDHLVAVAGIDHVAIGSDYDLGDIPTEVDRAGKLPNLTAELLRRGYSEADIRKIWGENFLRVFREVLHG
jgi:membrane dipeptidase